MKKDRDNYEKIDNTKYIDVEVEKEVKTSFMAYAMAVNVSRAIPDVRDGLKPVHRRILYSMGETGLWNDKPFKKCARIVGDVLGKYHPHGDSSVYDALVRLAQNFSINCPLVDGHGNFGSVDGDPAAAYRYTEARLSKIAAEMLRDIDKNTVDFYPNFDETLMQPSVLPSRFPNLLVNGSDGIAVGMATNIPPHNLGEVINGVLAMIDNPNITVDELMNIIPAPDFPTGGIVIGRNGIRDAYTTGRGNYIIRSKAEIEEFDDGKRYRIIVNEIPYQVNKAKLITQIADLAKDKRIEGISGVRDESDRDGLRIVIELKREANAQVVLNTLFKLTQMQVSNGIIFLTLVNGQPKVLNLKEMLFYYLQYQKEIIVRRTKYDLEKATEREHIVEGLVIAVQNIDDVVKTIKESDDKVDATNKLIERFNLTDKQANAILEMKLSRLTGLEVTKLQEELVELKKIMEDLQSILDNPSRVSQIIKDELSEIRDKYAKNRISEIGLQLDDGFNMGDFIEKEDVVISLTNQGYVKRMPVSEYRSQNRGGKGVTGHKTKEEDYVINMFAVNSHDDLLFFTNKGKVYGMVAYMVPEATKTSKGRALVNLLELETDEKVTTMLIKGSGEQGHLMMATALGNIKKTEISEFENIRKNGKVAIKLEEGDTLVSVKFVKEDDECLIASTNGKCLRFPASCVRALGRASIGVMSMRLENDERIVDMIVVDKSKQILTVTSKGFAKRTLIDDYRLQGRGGKGIKAGEFNDKTGTVISLKNISEDQDILLITNEGVVIRIEASQINLVGRTAQGVRIMRTEGDDRIVSADVVERVEETEEEIDDIENSEEINKSLDVEEDFETMEGTENMEFEPQDEL